jgi:prepilin-type N-terminal cleavage/methylation domain-containing protein
MMKRRERRLLFGHEGQRGFTLIELAVAMGVLLVIIYMSLAAFGYVGAMSRTQQSREVALESVSTVLDQMTKELRQCVTKTNLGVAFYQGGIPYPATSTTRDVSSIIDSPPNAGAGVPYNFNTTKGPILQFFSLGDDGSIYRISYTLGVPASGAIAQRFWEDASWQPCQVLYTREKWTDTNGDWTPQSTELAMVVNNQPVTDQVVTNLTIVRPLWSSKIIQVIIMVAVKDASGKATEITRIAQVALRQ